MHLQTTKYILTLQHVYVLYFEDIDNTDQV